MVTSVEFILKLSSRTSGGGGQMKTIDILISAGLAALLAIVVFYEVTSVLPRASILP